MRNGICRRTTPHRFAHHAHQFRTRRTTRVHMMGPRLAPRVRRYRARFTGMPRRMVPEHQFRATVHQVGSILAFLARFLRKEATAWLV
ncbi:hypothetical protein [Burkholderia sp. S-53]|uniref:hypothetical protein n=1 Tax=Burkholderia sp. S-53 TaxID=2906514 RepID=UPI0021CFED10|nr:hypothetical protein [Burkholderia sp. S-53]UXU88966.1 hypothetical protein LXM88_11060 [Burkholderia sp. S-53]